MGNEPAGGSGMFSLDSKAVLVSFMTGRIPSMVVSGLQRIKNAINQIFWVGWNVKIPLTSLHLIV